MNRFACVFGVATAMAVALASCSPAEQDPVPPAASHIVAGRLAPEERSASIAGTVGVQDGCVVLRDSSETHLVIWPSGTTLSSNGRTISLPGGSLDVGEEVEPARGYRLDRASFDALVGNADVSGLEECSPDTFETFVVLLNAQGFDYQE